MTKHFHFSANVVRRITIEASKFYYVTGWKLVTLFYTDILYAPKSPPAGGDLVGASEEDPLTAKTKTPS